MSTSRIIRDYSFDIDERAVLRHQGYRPSSPVSDRVRSFLDEAIARVMEHAHPHGIWKVEKIVGAQRAVPLQGVDLVRISGGLEIRSRHVARLFRGCVEAVIFAVTIGPQAETEVESLMQAGDAAESLMMDCVASEAVEGCAEQLTRIVQNDAHKRNMHLTPRFSPGFGDWTVDHQSELFAALEPERIGIKLTESSMMIPRKSITAILGLGPIEDIRTGASPCKECSRAEKNYE